MNYLLDTHAFLWSIFDPQKLSENAGKTILNPENNIYVSIITFWEISLKYSMGKLDLVNVLPDDLPSVSREAGFDILEINADEVSAFYKLPKQRHKDLFDRLIIWQAINRKLILITKDSQFDDYKISGLKTFW